MDAVTVRKAIERRFKKTGPAPGKSVIFGRRKENSELKELAENLKTAVYFCHPRSPREKGTRRNANYLIRDMPYPVDAFRELTQRGVSIIAGL